ncbi:MAG TPA: hypothetical protein VHI96_02095 [Solirubrobacterales bacterium]|jgi:hypothetical protein|nr:hypothetical protein [Solirubrobacterales bacterium]
MDIQRTLSRIINPTTAFGAGALLSGPLWRPDLARQVDDWLFLRGVVMPWRRSCPVPQQRSGS